MSWCVETEHGEIAKDAVLAIFRQPWIDGERPGMFPVDATLSGHFPNGVPFSLIVVETDSHRAAVVSYNAAHWSITRVEASQLPFRPQITAGAPATYWVVGDQV